jgi:hypothetical protein
MPITIPSNRNRVQKVFVKFLIGGGIAVIILATLWLFTAQWCSRLIDRVYTAPLATLPSTPVGWNGSYLQFGSSPEGAEGPRDGWNGDLRMGSHILGLEGPGPDYKSPATIAVDANDRLVVSTGRHELALGSRAGTLSGGDGPIPAFAAEPGDTTAVTIDASWLSWPTPFEMNFMTGHAPTWRRSFYYRLSWTKATGARLDMLWRLEQGFYGDSGWASPGHSDTATGLIRAEIQPAPASLR